MDCLKCAVGVVFSDDGYEFQQMACMRSEGGYGGSGAAGRLGHSLTGSMERTGGGDSHRGSLTAKRLPELGSQIIDMRLRWFRDSRSLGGCSVISVLSGNRGNAKKNLGQCWSEEMLFYRCGWWLQTVGSYRIWQWLVRMLVGDLIEEMDGMCGWMI